MTCGQLPVGGCGNPDLGHDGKCTPYRFVGLRVLADDETGDTWIYFPKETQDER